MKVTGRTDLREGTLVKPDEAQSTLGRDGEGGGSRGHCKDYKGIVSAEGPHTIRYCLYLPSTGV